VIVTVEWRKLHLNIIGISPCGYLPNALRQLAWHSLWQQVLFEDGLREEAGII
jgi:hypothetical protein